MQAAASHPFLHMPPPPPPNPSPPPSPPCLPAAAAHLPIHVVLLLPGVLVAVEVLRCGSSESCTYGSSSSRRGGGGVGGQPAAPLPARPSPPPGDAAKEAAPRRPCRGRARRPRTPNPLPNRMATTQPNVANCPQPPNHLHGLAHVRRQAALLGPLLDQRQLAPRAVHLVSLGRGAAERIAWEELPGHGRSNKGGSGGYVHMTTRVRAGAPARVRECQDVRVCARVRVRLCARPWRGADLAART